MTTENICLSQGIYQAFAGFDSWCHDDYQPFRQCPTRKLRKKAIKRLRRVRRLDWIQLKSTSFILLWFTKASPFSPDMFLILCERGSDAPEKLRSRLLQACYFQKHLRKGNILKQYMQKKISELASIGSIDISEVVPRESKRVVLLLIKRNTWFLTPALYKKRDSSPESKQYLRTSRQALKMSHGKSFLFSQTVEHGVVFARPL